MPSDAAAEESTGVESAAAGSGASAEETHGVANATGSGAAAEETHGVATGSGASAEETPGVANATGNGAAAEETHGAAAEGAITTVSFGAGATTPHRRFEAAGLDGAEMGLLADALASVAVMSVPSW